MAEGSLLYLYVVLTWSALGFVLTCLILAYSVVPILDAAFFLCLPLQRYLTMCGTVEVLCVFSVYEINSTYLYCLYLDRK